MTNKKKPLSNLKPIKDWVLVRKNFAVKMGSILLPTENRPTDGVILNIGDDVKDVNIGDHVYFHYAAGTTIEHGGEKLSIIKECDLWGVFSDAD